MPDRTFDRRSCLAFVQHYRLVIDNAVLIQHVRIHPYRMRATSRIAPDHRNIRRSAPVRMRLGCLS